jgi:hypothetical protein
LGALVERTTASMEKAISNGLSRHPMLLLFAVPTEMRGASIVNATSSLNRFQIFVSRCIAFSTEILLSFVKPSTFNHR